MGPARLTRWAAFVVAASLLPACLSDGIELPPLTSPPPATTPASPAPASPSPSPTGSAPEAGTYVSVEGVSVDVCRRCVRAAERAGWDLRREIRRVLRRATRRLPGVETRVTVTLAESGPGVAAGAARRTSGEIRLRLNLRRSPSAVMATLPLLLSHELHHAQRIVQGPGYGATLVEDLVAEGLADAFALELYRGYPEEAWVPQLSEDAMATLWQRARRASRRPYSAARYRRWFGPGGPLPPRAGYALGYALVQAYLARHPRASAAELALVGAEEIVEGSGFPP